MLTPVVFLQVHHTMKKVKKTLSQTASSVHKTTQLPEIEKKPPSQHRQGVVVLSWWLVAY